MCGRVRSSAGQVPLQVPLPNVCCRALVPSVWPCALWILVLAPALQSTAAKSADDTFNFPFGANALAVFPFLDPTYIWLRVWDLKNSM